MAVGMSCTRDWHRRLLAMTSTSSRAVGLTLLCACVGRAQLDSSDAGDATGVPGDDQTERPGDSQNPTVCRPMKREDRGGVIDITLSLGLAAGGPGGVSVWGTHPPGSGHGGWQGSYDDLPVPAGSVVDVSADNENSCFVSADHEMKCWAQTSTVMLALPSIGVAEILAPLSCALLVDGTVACPEGTEYRALAEVTNSVHVAAWPRFIGGRSTTVGCSLDAAGTATCWGDDALDRFEGAGRCWNELEVGYAYACAVDAGGTANCVHLSVPTGEGITEVPPPVRPVHGLQMASDHACALDSDGRVACWGEFGPTGRPLDWSLAPWEPFEAIVVRDGGIGCGVMTSGTVACWGPASAPVIEDAPR